MSIFAQASSALFGMLKAATAGDGATYSYRRGNDAVQVDAVPGRSLLEIDDGNGAVVTFGSNDWIIPAAQLVLNDARIRPQATDQLLRARSGVVDTFEVIDPPYRPSDADGTHLRIHTRLISSAPATP